MPLIRAGLRVPPLDQMIEPGHHRHPFSFSHSPFGHEGVHALGKPVVGGRTHPGSFVDGLEASAHREMPVRSEIGI